MAFSGCHQRWLYFRGEQAWVEMKQPTKKLVALGLALACECASGFTFMKNWKLPGRRDVNRELAGEKFGDKSKLTMR